MKSFQGRINRRTYIVGSAISVATAGIFVVFFLAPFALLELALPNWDSGGILEIIQQAFLLIPAVYFILMTVLLTSRRAQDFGNNGTKWTLALFGIFGINHFLDWQILSLVTFLIVLTLVLKPGAKKRNKYGGKQPDKLNLQDVYRI